MKKSEFHKLFVNELKGIYWLENNWITTVKELEETAVSERLKETLKAHNLLNMEAVVRLDRVFGLLGIPYIQREYDFVHGLITDIRRLLTVTDHDSMVRDAAILISVQKSVHYSIATYGSLATLARFMDLSAESQLLGNSLEDKKRGDAELTVLAENYINLKALHE